MTDYFKIVDADRFSYFQYYFKIVDADRFSYSQHLFKISLLVSYSINLSCRYLLHGFSTFADLFVSKSKRRFRSCFCHNFKSVN